MNMVDPDNMPDNMGVNADLASEIKTEFDRDGYYFPCRIMQEHKAHDYRSQFEALEPQISGMKLGNKNQLNYGHVLFPFVHEIITAPALLDVVERLIGPDILVWGTTFCDHRACYRRWQALCTVDLQRRTEAIS